MAETISTGSKAGAAVLGPLLTTLDLPCCQQSSSAPGSKEPYLG